MRTYHPCTPLGTRVVSHGDPPALIGAEVAAFLHRHLSKGTVRVLECGHDAYPWDIFGVNRHAGLYKRWRERMMQRIHPYLLYEDPAAAAEFLTAAFGFRRVEARGAHEGHLSHSHIELELDTGFRIRMSSPDEDYRNPRSTGQVTSMMQLDVSDIEVHFARATKTGATVVTPLQQRPYGDRNYVVDDLEGHRWNFIERAPHDSLR